MGFFSRKPPEPPPPQTRITRGTHIQGAVESKADFTLEGTLEGSIRCGGEVILGPSAQFSGELHAESLKCLGSGQGLAEIRCIARFGAGATWDGTYRTGALSIEKGAHLQGSFTPPGGAAAPSRREGKVPATDPPGRS